MLNRLDLLRRAVINISKNLMAFWRVFCLFGMFLLLITFLCVQSRNSFQKLVTEESTIHRIAIDIQIGAL